MNINFNNEKLDTGWAKCLDQFRNKKLELEFEIMIRIRNQKNIKQIQRELPSISAKPNIK